MIRRAIEVAVQDDEAAVGSIDRFFLQKICSVQTLRELQALIDRYPEVLLPHEGGIPQPCEEACLAVVRLLKAEVGHKSAVLTNCMSTSAKERIDVWERQCNGAMRLINLLNPSVKSLFAWQVKDVFWYGIDTRDALIESDYLASRHRWQDVAAYGDRASGDEFFALVKICGSWRDIRDKGNAAEFQRIACPDLFGKPKVESGVLNVLQRRRDGAVDTVLDLLQCLIDKGHFSWDAFCSAYVQAKDGEVVLDCESLVKRLAGYREPPYGLDKSTWADVRLEELVAAHAKQLKKASRGYRSTLVDALLEGLKTAPDARSTIQRPVQSPAGGMKADGDLGSSRGAHFKTPGQTEKPSGLLGGLFGRGNPR